ncbi:MAG TPA: hypothetical protein VFX37_15105 [Pseudolabrys sp.]|nr:hypothetical protein [Pseudolabrys sp.]
MSAYVPAATVTDLKAFWRAIVGLASGRSNATGTVTLAVSETSTTVTDANCASGSFIGLMPMTANAAGALSGISITTSNGSFVITHDSSTEDDRQYTYAIQG